MTDDDPRTPGQKSNPVSASQIKTSDMCLRKWAFNKIDKLSTPSTPSTAKGTAVHTVLEQWLSKGIPPPDDEIGLIAKAGLKHLPAPSKDLIVEEKFYIKLPEVHFLGFIDVQDLRDPKLPLVIDHKTTKSFSWNLTPEQLREDVQAIMYAKAVLMKTGAPEVLLRWVYYKTTGTPESTFTEVKLSLTEVNESFNRILQKGMELVHFYLTAQTAEDVPPNPGEACDAFGGCYFRERCNQMGLFNTVKSQASGINPPDAAKSPIADAVSAPAKEASASKGLFASKGKTKSAPSLEKTSAKTAAVKPTTGGELWVFVDCLPTKTQGESITPLAKILQPVLEAVNVENNVADYRFMEYGTGPAALNAAFGNWLEQNKLTGYIYVNSSSPEERTVLNTLLAKADLTIKGV